MKLLLIRHAAAVPRGTPGVPDDDRPLTRDGKAKFRVAARGLARFTRRPDVLLTSPLPRARVTAKIAAHAFEHTAPTIELALAHSSVDGIVAALKTHPPGARIALVGHEPLLGALLGRLLGTTQGEQLTLQKGGAALVDLPNGPEATGSLRWFLKPRILRALARPAQISGPRATPPAVAEGRNRDDVALPRD